MVPMNLRVRIVMTGNVQLLSRRAGCAGEGADYKGRANSFKRSVHDRQFRNAEHRTAAP